MLVDGGIRDFPICYSYTVTAGSYQTHAMVSSAPCTVRVTPGASGSMDVYYQLASTGSWCEWAAGSVTEATVYVLCGPVYALKFTATTSPGTAEIVQ